MSPLLLTLLLACGAQEAKPPGPAEAPAEPGAGTAPAGPSPDGAIAPAPPLDGVAPGGGGAPGAAVPAGEAAAPGGAAAPGEAPVTGAFAVPSGGRPNPMGFVDAVGEPVKVGGTVKYDGGLKGVLRVDLMRPGAEGVPPVLLATSTLPRPGAWGFEVPTGAGQLFVVAFLDTNDNGPEPTEPQSKPVGLEVTDKPIAGVDLVLAAGGDADSTKGAPTFTGG